MDHSIGAVARLTGVTVKTVRYYSDLGLLPCTRSAAGQRRYGDDAVARLRLIRTLRTLGIDVPTVRAVLAAERTLADVAATHARALTVQISTLQRQQALLEVLVHSPELMEDLVQQSEEDRRVLVAQFLRSAIGDDPALAAVRQNLTPDAGSDQVEEWQELTTLMRDADFVESVRRMAVGYQALAGSERLWADREQLMELRRTAGGARWERYVELVAVVNGWDSRVAG